MHRLVRLQADGSALVIDEPASPPEMLELPANADPHAIAAQLAPARIVAIRIESFTDGRAYSLARLLRERYRYSGELRAVGDVLRDQVPYLARCGFDAFALRADQDPYDAIAALSEISVRYQADARRGAH